MDSIPCWVLFHAYLPLLNCYILGYDTAIPKKFTHPLQILTENAAEKLGDSAVGGGLPAGLGAMLGGQDNPLFSAALQQMAR